MARRNGRGGAQVGPPDRGKEAAFRPAPGRICNQEGCTTILSVYNASGACWPHSDPDYRHSPGRY